MMHNAMERWLCCQAENQMYYFFKAWLSAVRLYLGCLDLITGFVYKQTADFAYMQVRSRNCTEILRMCNKPLPAAQIDMKKLYFPLFFVRFPCSFCICTFTVIFCKICVQNFEVSAACTKTLCRMDSLWPYMQKQY